ncbi:MAG: hypothetical protein A3D65_03850 [Candidatus Lloydbacteria bacterium RIFCSPHIGHO2_02_FULL_50_13]|uniref:Cytotoxic translational repressor of toxin-antitoxin stability system n=1 Tax=Candidatus Lloydbacteria bacterium RIFCSPHIGHO2_02_FULL_50_13 TaxID=1798661 RepID=A0A1G2D206_9BACT|nr:MAG: hypothetical protein A3D65_03850 [Candidatus Lloydbacteria bacterium RIFCSPHIGHO2_02_FULL_50_13]
MDALDKLFRKITPKEQVLLLELLKEIKDSELRTRLQIKKLTGGKYFRVRKRSFRIIFHFKDGRVAIDEIRLRNEKTYRGF